MRRHRKPRCIAIDGGQRCPRNAGKRSGDIYVCNHHSRLITMALIDDMLTPYTRAMLARMNWETAREGQRLIDRSNRRAA